MNLRTLLFLTKRLSKKSSKHRRKRSSASLKKDKYLKEPLKTLPATEYSWILAVLTDLFTLPIFHGDVFRILKRSLSLTRRSMSLFLISMIRKNVLLSDLNNFLHIHGKAFP